MLSCLLALAFTLPFDSRLYEGQGLGPPWALFLKALMVPSLLHCCIPLARERLLACCLGSCFIAWFSCRVAVYLLTSCALLVAAGWYVLFDIHTCCCLAATDVLPYHVSFAFLVFCTPFPLAHFLQCPMSAIRTFLGAIACVCIRSCWDFVRFYAYCTYCCLCQLRYLLLDCGCCCDS